MPTDAVLMPIYPVPAIEHNHAHDDKLYPHSIYGPYWRPSGRTLTIDGAETPCTPAKLAVHTLLDLLVLSSLHCLSRNPTCDCQFPRLPGSPRSSAAELTACQSCC